MSVSVTMPRLGESVSEGTITRWLKSEGDAVEADEPLLEVSTDKVDTEIPAPASGVLKSIKVAEDETVEVGAELAVIDEGGGGGGGDAADADQEAEEAKEAKEDRAAGKDQVQEDEEPESEPEEPDEPEAKAEPEPEPEPAAEEQPDEQPDDEEQPEPQRPAASDEDDEGGGGSAYVTPLVRKLAAEHDVDLSSVKGSGVGGRIRKQDVLEAAKTGGTKPAQQQEQQQEQQPAAKAEPPRQAAPGRQPARQPATSARGRTEKMSRLRKVIAERMTESLQISAQLTTVAEVDVSGIARLIADGGGEFEAREGVKLRFLPFFGLAACEALKEHPAVNASIDMDESTVTYHDAVHLGVAVDTPRGLLVPVIHDAGDLNLGGLARKIADLATRTRENQVTPDELGGGTFTLTNTGSRGVIIDTPIINQPQVAILGTGAVVKRPVVVDDPDLGEVIAIRHMVYLCLTYDHRMIDGADAARFVTTMKRRLEDAASFEAELGK